MKNNNDHLVYDTLFQANPDLFCLIDNDGKFIELNPAWQRIMGYTPEELINTPFIDLLHPNDNNFAEIRTHLKQKNNQSDNISAIKCKCKDGSYKWLEWKSGLCLDQSCSWGVARDITENLSLQEKLKLHEEIFKYAGWGIAASSNDKIDLINPAFAEMHGYTVEELIGRPIIDIIAPGFKEKLYEQLRISLHKGHFSFESKDIRKDGSTFPVWVSVSVIRNSRNEFQYRAVNILDMTDLKNTQKKLEQSEEKYRKLMENIFDVIMVYNLNQKRFLYISPSIEHLTGYTNIETMNFTFDEFTTSKYAEKIKNDINTGITKFNNDPTSLNKLYKMEFQFNCKDGSLVWVEINARVQINSNNEAEVVCVARNIEERKRNEKLIEQTKEILRKFATHLQNTQEQDKILLASRIDNELAQQLVSLKMEIGLLKNSILNTEDMDTQEHNKLLNHAYTTIGKSIESTVKIMNNLREEVLTVMGFVEGVNLYIDEYKKKYNIHCHFNTKVKKLNLTQMQSVSLFRIFQSAMTNIAQHAKATYIIIKLENKKDILTLTIKDNGTGFDTENLKNKDASGILFMKERAELMDGTFYISSCPDTGTVIKVEIPYGE